MATTRELETERERRDAVPILQQLWSEKSREEVLEWTSEAEYHQFGRFVDGELVGVVGVTIESVLHHERHAWIPDLAVDDAHRGEGHGTALLEFVEGWAAEQGCEHVALASPLAKEAVHEFYENRDYERWGYVIEKGV
jgi:GNAT superfamily N-acetyltransferase